MAEKNYDFRKRLAILHPPRLASDAEPVQHSSTPHGKSFRSPMLL